MVTSSERASKVSDALTLQNDRAIYLSADIERSCISSRNPAISRPASKRSTRTSGAGTRPQALGPTPLAVRIRRAVLSMRDDVSRPHGYPHHDDVWGQQYSLRKYVQSSARPNRVATSPHSAMALDAIIPLWHAAPYEEESNTPV